MVESKLKTWPFGHLRDPHSPKKKHSHGMSSNLLIQILSIHQTNTKVVCFSMTGTRRRIHTDDNLIIFLFSTFVFIFVFILNILKLWNIVVPNYCVCRTKRMRINNNASINNNKEEWNNNIQANVYNIKYVQKRCVCFAQRWSLPIMR